MHIRKTPVSAVKLAAVTLALLLAMPGALGAQEAPNCPPEGCDGDAPLRLIDKAADGRLIGGTAAGKTPWQVAIISGGDLVPYGRDPRAPDPLPEWSLRQQCGGALIAPDWVLTAGHCISADKTYFKAPVNLAVRLGALRLDSPDMQTIAVKRVVRHPGFTLYFTQNDVALLQLARPVKLQPGRIETIALPDAPTPVGMDVQLTGWGKTEKTAPGETPVELQFIPLKTLDNAQCRAAGFTSVSDTDLCAGGPNVSQCSGDSGGPLAMKTKDDDGRTRWVLVGTVSRSISKCPAGTPGLYARTSSFTAWIRQTIATSRRPAQ